MKIINDGLPKGDEILLDEISIKYCQENDCTESDDDWQEITISTRDGGGGKFLNIKTDNWSFTDANELKELIDDFTKRYKEN